MFEQNGVKITNDKASSTNNCIAVSNEAYASRFYAGSTIKIEYANMTKIVITLDDGNYNGKTYVAGFDGMDVSGATITTEQRLPLYSILPFRYSRLPVWQVKFVFTVLQFLLIKFKSRSGRVSASAFNLKSLDYIISITLFCLLFLSVC